MSTSLQKVAQAGTTYVAVTSMALKKAVDQLAANQTARQKAAAAAEQSLQHLQACGLIADNRVKEARDLLSTHEGACSLLYSVGQRCRDLMKAAQTKKADDASKTSHDLGGPAGDNGQLTPSDTQLPLLVGGRSTEKRGSDLALLSVLGAPKRN